MPVPWFIYYIAVCVNICHRQRKTTLTRSRYESSRDQVLFRCFPVGDMESPVDVSEKANDPRFEGRRELV